MGARDTSPFSRLPQRFGKYSVLGHLATGGMAEVYLARAAGIEGFEKIVVIKRIRPELIGDKQTTELFLHEARLAATLEHPNIAQVHEIGIVNDSYFFAMEYVHGADLRQLMEAAVHKERSVSLADAIKIICDVCAALHSAHEKRDFEGKPLNIIHRDVSPSNVLISHDGAVKVCDFGIAKATGRQTETVRGVVKGKFAYMSPEQCLCEVTDRRSDIFAISILLYEISTLTRLFNAPSDFELMRMVVDEGATPPSQVRQDYPPELERIVMKGLSRQRDDRYPTAQAMQLELEAFAREHKLALSSVNIAKLMGELFEKRSQAWVEAQRSGMALGDHLLDRQGYRDSIDSMPTFTPMIGDEDAADINVHVTPQPEPVTTYNRQTRAPLQRVWLAGAVFSIVAAAGITGYDVYQSRATTGSTTTAVQTEAEKIGGMLDSEAHNARLRADSIATAPMLRAAIETDAATVKDMAQTEHLFSPEHGEVLEVFQDKNGVATSLLRIPHDAPPVKPIQGHDTRLETDGKDITMVVSAPVNRYSSAGIGGSLVISFPIDLAAIRKRLATHAVAASLTGLGPAVPLVGAAAWAAPSTSVITAPVVLTGEWSSLKLDLLAVAPTATGRAAWIVPMRYASCGLAAAMLILYLIGLRRRRAPADQ